MDKSLPKIEFKEAVKMLDTGYYLMHLNYLLGGERSEIYRKNCDCSHFLVKAGQDWRNPNNPIVLVIADAEAEQKYLGSRAGTEKYGEQDRTYEELIIENQLLKKAVITFLHDSASPIRTLRSGEGNVKYWVEKCIKSTEGSEDKEAFDRILRIGKRMIKAVDTLNKFYRTLWRAVDRRNPPDNEELRTIIADIGKILDAAWEASKDKEV